jgi:hypothetical protein
MIRPMSAVAGSSIAARPRPDHRRPGPSAAAGLERSVGRIRLGVVADDGGRTQLSELCQRGAAKVRFPDADAAGPLEAVLLNTAGGVTGGDHLRYEAKAGASARATITTQAAERVYRRSAGNAPSKPPARRLPDVSAKRRQGMERSSRRPIAGGQRSGTPHGPRQTG